MMADTGMSLANARSEGDVVEPFHRRLQPRSGRYGDSGRKDSTINEIAVDATDDKADPSVPMSWRHGSFG
jgi:hypothetical protein